MERHETFELCYSFGTLEITPAECCRHEIPEYFWEFKKDGDVRLKSTPRGMILTVNSVESDSQEIEEFFVSLLEKVPRILDLLSSYHFIPEPILYFFLTCEEEVLEVAKSNRALGWLAGRYCGSDLLPNQSVDTKWRCKEIARLKRRKLISRFGLPEEEWIVRLLGKIPAEDCSDNTFMKFKSIVKELERVDAEKLKGFSSNIKRKYKLLQHLTQLNALVIDILSNDGLFEMVCDSFIREVSVERDVDLQSELLEVLWGLHEELQNETLQALYKISAIRSWNHLYEVRDQVCEWIEEIEDFHHISPMIFMQPPIPSIRFEINDEVYGIWPIRNGKEILREGEIMKSCVATYAHTIEESGCRLCLYHVHLPGGNDATVLIEMVSDRYFIDQIRGKNNSDATKNVRLTVERWLDKWNMRKS